MSLLWSHSTNNRHSLTKVLAVGFLGLLLTASVLPTTAPRADAKARPRNGLIVFSVREDRPYLRESPTTFVDNVDLFTVDPRSGLIERLTDDIPYDEAAAWSPDGRQLAFGRSQVINTSRDLYVMNGDGSGLRNLTSTPIANEALPAWSPDGKRIAFIRTDPDVALTNIQEDPNLYVIDADGTGLAPVLVGASSPDWPAWHPNGRSIAYVDNATNEINIINVDGSQPRRLDIEGAVTGTVLGPKWSPDGRWIVFTTQTGANFFGDRIWIVRADGTGLKRLVPIPDSENFQPRWSPDGKKIVFVNVRDADWNLFTMNPDGSGVQRLTDIGIDMAFPDWGPRP